MKNVLLLTSDSLLETSLRLACLADGLEIQVDPEVSGTIAALVDIDGLGPEQAELARRLQSTGLPILAVVEDALKMQDWKISAYKVASKPVESTKLVFLVRELISSRFSRACTDGATL